MSRTRRATWTFALSLGGTVSGVALALITTPILLHHLGDERVGAYRAAAEWVGYLALLDFGIAGSLQVAFARAIGTGNRIGLAGAVRAGVRAGFFLGLLSAVFGLGLALLAPQLLRDASAELTAELRIGLLVALLGAVWGPLIAFRPLADAGQRGHIVQIGLTLQAWVTAGLLIGLAASGFGLPGQFFAVAAGGGVGSLLLARDGLRRFPEILSRSAPAVALPTAFSGAMFAYNLLGRIGLHSDSIIVGMTLGPTSVVAFALTQRLLLLADSQVMALGSSSWAALAELHHQGKTELFNRRLTQLTRLTGVLGFAMIVPLAAATRPFVTLWVGDSRFGGDWLVASTAAYVWVHTITALWGWPLMTTGRVRLVLPIYIVGIPLNIAISIAGAIHIGPVGPALGSAISMVLIWLPWLPLLLRREFQTPLRPLIRAVAGPAMVGIPSAAAVYGFAIYVPLHELSISVWARWVILLAFIGFGSVAYLVLAWITILPAGDQAELRGRLLGR